MEIKMGGILDFAKVVEFLAKIATLFSVIFGISTAYHSYEKQKNDENYKSMVESIENETEFNLSNNCIKWCAKQVIDQEKYEKETAYGVYHAFLILQDNSVAKSMNKLDAYRHIVSESYSQNDLIYRRYREKADQKCASQIGYINLTRSAGDQKNVWIHACPEEESKKKGAAQKDTKARSVNRNKYSYEDFNNWLEDISGNFFPAKGSQCRKSCADTLLHFGIMLDNMS
jgi:hypothetical protein